MNECTVFTYADDTQLFKSAKKKNQLAISADLKRLMSGLNSTK